MVFRNLYKLLGSFIKMAKKRVKMNSKKYLKTTSSKLAGKNYSVKVSKGKEAEFRLKDLDKRFKWFVKCVNQDNKETVRIFAKLTKRIYNLEEKIKRLNGK